MAINIHNEISYANWTKPRMIALTTMLPKDPTVEIKVLASSTKLNEFLLVITVAWALTDFLFLFGFLLRSYLPYLFFRNVMKNKWILGVDHWKWQDTIINTFMYVHIIQVPTRRNSVFSACLLAWDKLITQARLLWNFSPAPICLQMAVFLNVFP